MKVQDKHMPLRSENLVKALFRDTRDLIGIADKDRTIVAVNNSFQDAFGYSEREIVGKKTEVLYANDGIYEALGQDRFHSGAIDRQDMYRVVYRKKDRETFIGETRSVVIHDEHNAVVGFMGIIRDVSDSVEREQFFLEIAKLNSDTNLALCQRIQSLLDISQSYLKTSAAVVVAHESVAHLFGENPILSSLRPSLKETGVSCQEMLDLHQESLPAAEGNAAQQSHDCPEDLARSVIEPLTVGGEEFGCLHLFSSRPDEENSDRVSEVIKLIGMTIASHIKLAQQNHALDLRQAHFRTLYRKTPAIMHSIDGTGCITEVSDEWLKALDYKRDDVIGKKSSAFLTSASQQDALNVIPKFWADGFVDRYPYTFVSSGGLPVEIELSAVLNPDKTSLAVLEDVTERNAARRQLLEKNHELENANEELRQFAFVASHDLQEPLRKIQSFCDILQEAVDKGNATDIEYAMSVVKNSAERSSRLISDLLSLSRTGNRDFTITECDADTTIRDALDDVSMMIAESDATILRNIGSAQIIADRPTLVQLLRNLVNNAIKYRRPGVSPKILVGFDRHEEEDLLTVADNGIGIDRRHYQTIFEPFKRLHRQSEYEGTGIGLAICKKIADRHGWRIEVEAPENGGTVFSIHMPRRAQDSNRGS